MKIMILGATGMAGHTIALYLMERGHKITAYNRRNFQHCPTIIGDVTDFQKLKDIIEDFDFDAVINAVGVLNMDAENNKLNAVLVNSVLPHFLADITKDSKTKVIHLSTDCVFSGLKGDYNEFDITDGQTYYDRSKALGEIVNNKDLTFRNSIVGPDINANGYGLFNWFMKQNDEIFGYETVFWSGVTTLTLAKAIEKALEQDLKGLYHLVNNQKISKFDLLLLFNKYFRDNMVRVNLKRVQKIDKSLINNRVDFNFVVPSYEDMIIEMKEWVIDHIELYPHYKM